MPTTPQRPVSAIILDPRKSKNAATAALHTLVTTWLYRPVHGEKFSQVHGAGPRARDVILHRLSVGTATMSFIQDGGCLWFEILLQEPAEATS